MLMVGDMQGVAGDTSLEQLGCVQGEVGWAPGGLAAAIHVDPLNAGVGLAVEVWAVDNIGMLGYAA